LDQYSVVVPPLDPYYSAADKTGFETFLDNVGDTKCFYTTFESDLTKRFMVMLLAMIVMTG